MLSQELINILLIIFVVLTILGSLLVYGLIGISLNKSDKIISQRVVKYEATF